MSAGGTVRRYADRGNQLLALVVIPRYSHDRDIQVRRGRTGRGARQGRDGGLQGDMIAAVGEGVGCKVGLGEALGSGLDEADEAHSAKRVER